MSANRDPIWRANVGKQLEHADNHKRLDKRSEYQSSPSQRPERHRASKTRAVGVEVEPTQVHVLMKEPTAMQ